MPGEETRRYSAGDFVDDLCRACKLVREHRVITADSDGNVLRVICDYCGSQHNYRGGGDRPHPSRASGASEGFADTGQPEPLVSERERRYPIVSLDGDEGKLDLELMLRRIIREESGLTAVAIADKWRGGEIVLKPGRAGVQSKSLPIESFFNKVVMLRNKLRVLEQNINT